MLIEIRWRGKKGEQSTHLAYYKKGSVTKFYSVQFVRPKE